MQVLRSAVTEVQFKRLCSKTLVNKWTATLPHRDSAVCRRSHRFLWKRLWLVASRRCWRVQRRTKVLRRLEGIGLKTWIYWTSIQLTWDDVTGSAITVSEARWNRQLSLLTCNCFVKNKLRQDPLFRTHRCTCREGLDPSPWWPDRRRAGSWTVDLCRSCKGK